MQDLNIALIQSNIFWESYEANLEIFEQKIDDITGNVNLIILPEMFSTGFSMNPHKLAHKMDGNVVNWMIKKSKEKSADITGSLIVKEDKKYYNRLIWVKANGVIEFYDKKHLFGYAGENKLYSPGNKRIIVDCCGWKICPLICYDLRFPLWNRNFSNSYDLALFVANWPEARSDSWKALLVARAIENQCYVVGVNRVGTDGNGIKYAGDSSVINPEGKIIAYASLKENLIRSSLSYKVLENIREKFPFWMDADTHLISHNLKNYIKLDESL